MLKLYHVLPEGDPLGGSREAEKIAVALNEIGAEYQIIALNRVRDMRPADSHYRNYVNHMGTVPTLDDDGFLLRESGAVLNYLAGKFPDAGLVPEDPRGRAKALEWVFWEGTTYIVPILHICFLHPFKDLDPAPFDAIMPFRGDRQAELRIAYEQAVFVHRYLDNALAGNEYVANNSYSIADIALGAHVALAGVLDIDLKPYKNIVAWLNRLSTRPAWRNEPVFAGDIDLTRKKRLI